MFEIEEQNEAEWSLDADVEQQVVAEAEEQVVAEAEEQVVAEAEEQVVAEAELQEEVSQVDADAEFEEQEDAVEMEADAQDVSGRIEGTVKWFSNPKGYGFISREGGEDVFVHYSEIQGAGFRSLSAGERVEFGLKQSEKGPRAVEVRSLETSVGSGWM